MTPALYSWAKIESWWGRDCYTTISIFVFSPVTLRHYDSHLYVSYVGLCNVCFFQRHCDGTTLQRSLILSIGMHMSVFSPVTLRHYDSSLSYVCMSVIKYFCFPAILRQYDTTKLRQSLVLSIHIMSVFSSATLRHYDSSFSYVCMSFIE